MKPSKSTFTLFYYRLQKTYCINTALVLFWFPFAIIVLVPVLEP